MSKPAFSLSDLQDGAKKLHHAEVSSSKESKSARIFEEESINSLVAIYEKYNGDLDLIFGELRADPSKAKKPHHRPKDAQEFANKYLQGYYSLVDDESDSKNSHK